MPLGITLFLRIEEALSGKDDGWDWVYLIGNSTC
jgi:hypothetical protein